MYIYFRHVILIHVEILCHFLSPLPWFYLFNFFLWFLFLNPNHMEFDSWTNLLIYFLNIYIYFYSHLIIINVICQCKATSTDQALWGPTRIIVEGNIHLQVMTLALSSVAKNARCHELSRHYTQASWLSSYLSTRNVLRYVLSSDLEGT